MQTVVGIGHPQTQRLPQHIRAMHLDVDIGRPQAQRARSSFFAVRRTMIDRVKSMMK